MDKILVANIFAAVFEKSLLDPLLAVLDPKLVKFWGTEGTVRYLRSKGFSATSVVTGFDFDGRVKSLDKLIFARILVDRTNKKHLEELRHVILEGSGDSRRPIGSKQEILSLRSRMTREGEFDPFDLVIVDLYKPDPKNFPESMDIGGQALIRAAIKNYKNVAVAFDKKSLKDFAKHIKFNQGASLLEFRREQASKAAKFVEQRCKMEAKYFGGSNNVRERMD